MNEIIVTKCVNELVPDLRWIVRLSNKEEIFRDDDRPDCTIKTAWLRLKNYVEHHKLNIEAVFLQFRSHLEALPEGKYGYYCTRGVHATTGFCREVWNFGFVDDDKIKVFKFVVPEIEARDYYELPFDPNNQFLILNKWEANHNINPDTLPIN